MNWNNIDLDSSYEKDQPIIDPLSTETLLLEINCNIKDINRKTVREQFEADLQSRIDLAREILEANLDNIVKCAKSYRK